MERLKQVMKDTYKAYDCGLFYTENTAGDALTVLYMDDDRRLEGCKEEYYYEAYGLTLNEQAELTDYYNKLRGCY